MKITIKTLLATENILLGILGLHQNLELDLQQGELNDGRNVLVFFRGKILLFKKAFITNIHLESSNKRN